MEVGFLEGPELVIVLVILVGFVVPIWAIIDIVRKPDWAWKAIRSSRAFYLVVIIVGLVVSIVIGLIAAIFYFLAVRPRLERAIASGPTSDPPPQ